MSKIDETTYTVLQMACELRRIISDRTDGMPDLGVPADCYPVPPLDNESVEESCKRIFGDYIFTKVVYERLHPEKKFPERFFKDFQPRESEDAPLASAGVVRRVPQEARKKKR